MCYGQWSLNTDTIYAEHQFFINPVFASTVYKLHFFYSGKYQGAKRTATVVVFTKYTANISYSFAYLLSVPPSVFWISLVARRSFIAIIVTTCLS